jgi:hypothetical protein
VPRYKVTVVDPSGGIGAEVSWKRYEAEALLEYGSEIVVESESPGGPGAIRARVTEVDNDAFFTNHVTVEPVGDAERHDS